MSLEERTNTNVTIELQNPNHQQYGGENVYMAGETIAGRLTVFCPSPITIRGSSGNIKFPKRKQRN